MPKPSTPFQKFKLLLIMDIFRTLTDETHTLTLADVQRELGRYDVSVERRTLYSDFNDLRDLYKFQIERKKKRYYLANPTFNTNELKILIDSIQSSKFLTEETTLSLIAKIKTLCSKYEAELLQRQVVVRDRVKSRNASVLSTVDTLHRAISAFTKVSFRYFTYYFDKGAKKHYNKRRYEVSPFSLIFEDNYYYLLAYDNRGHKFRHFRVDRIDQLMVLGTPCDGREAFESLDMEDYNKYTFGMFGGETTLVTMLFINRMASVAMDRFGQDVVMSATDANHFKITVPVAVSEQFYGWVLGLGRKVRILEPPAVIEGMEKLLRGVYRYYRPSSGKKL